MKNYQLIHLRIPIRDYEKISQLVNEKEYISLTDFVRISIKERLEKEMN